MLKNKKTIRKQQDSLDHRADQFIEKVAENIRKIRHQKNMSLIDVEEAGYPSWKHLQKIESSHKKPSLKTIYKVATALGITPSELLADCPVF